MRVVCQRKKGGQRVWSGAACVVDHQLRLWLVDEDGRRQRLGHCVDARANAWRLLGGDRAFPPQIEGEQLDSSDLRLYAADEEICGGPGERGHYSLDYDERVAPRVILSRRLEPSDGRLVRLPEHLSLDRQHGWRYVSWSSGAAQATHTAEITIAPQGFSLIGIRAAQAAKAASLHPRQRLSPLAERASA